MANNAARRKRSRSAPKKRRTRLVRAVYVPFGCLELRLDRLQLWGILVLRYRESHRYCSRWPAVNVSEVLQGLVLGLLDADAKLKAIPQDKLQALDETEREYLERLLHFSGLFGGGLHERLGYVPKLYHRDDKRRFEVLAGEIEAGNNNSDVKREAGRLGRNLYHKGAITKGKYDKLMRALASV